MADLLPQGYYDAVCVPTADEGGNLRYAHLAVAKTGTRQIVAYFEILNTPDGSKRRLPWFGAFTPDSGKRTVESLRFMGFTGDDIAAVEVQGLDQIVSVTVEHNEYEGKTRDRIAWVNAAGGGVAKFTAMDDNAKRQFAAMMKGKIVTVPEHKGERYTPKSEPERASDGAPMPSDDEWPAEQGGGGVGDDIPF